MVPMPAGVQVSTGETGRTGFKKLPRVSWRKKDARLKKVCLNGSGAPSSGNVLTLQQEGSTSKTPERTCGPRGQQLHLGSGLYLVYTVLFETLNSFQTFKKSRGFT